MTSLERMKAAMSDRKSDIVPFVPSVYEHGAFVIDRTPTEAATDARLMADAAIESYRMYGHDLITVGIDIYNVEAEAWGCRIKNFEDDSIPAIDSHPLGEGMKLDSSGLNPEKAIRGDNRLELLQEATKIVNREVDEETMVYTCVGGPFSQAVELRSFDKFLMDMIDDPDSIHNLMEKTTALTLHQIERISETGSGVNLYESWATLPLISPDIFKTFVIPYEKRIITAVKSKYDCHPPAIIMGGDSSIFIDYFIDADTSPVVADYLTDFAFMKKKLADAGSNMIIRGCLDPKKIQSGHFDAIDGPIRSLKEKSAGMNNFVWGCGCVPFDTSKENMLHFKEMCYGEV